MDVTDIYVAPVEEEKEELFEKKKKEARMARKNKCAVLTHKMNKTTELMCDPVNLEKVKENVQKYTEMLEDFKDLHKQYQQLLSKDECVVDTEQWYEPKLKNINEFKIKADEGIQFCPVQTLSERGDDISPKDSISSVSQVSCKSSRASSASARLVAQAEKAALLAKAAALKKGMLWKKRKSA